MVCCQRHGGQAELKTNVAAAVLAKYLSNTFLLSVDDGVVTIGVASPAAQEWLTNRASSMVARILTGLLAERPTVRFEILPPELIDEEVAHGVSSGRYRTSAADHLRA